MEQYTINDRKVSREQWSRRLEDGAYRRYGDDEQLEMETLFVKDGLIQGVQKWYRENGQLEMETPYADGHRTGIQRVYDINGRLRVEISVFYGRIHGIVTSYREDGQFERLTIYVNDRERPDLLAPRMRLARMIIFGSDILI